MSKQKETVSANGKASAEQVNNTEETISSFIRDCKKNIKNSIAGSAAIEKLPSNTPELKSAKESMLNALKGQKELIAKQAAQKVYEYLLRTE